MEEYNEQVELDTKILAGDIEAYKIVIQELKPFDEFEELRVKIKYNEILRDRIKLELYGDDTTIVPKQTKSLLKSGKLSIKDIPVSKRNELYQDYICSAILRVGRELFALLPLSEIIINTKAEMLNTATGIKEFKTILSIKLMRDTMTHINFDLIDPSDSMQNFLHNMKYKKTQGFLPVEEL